MFSVPVYDYTSPQFEEDRLYLSSEQAEQLAGWVRRAMDADLAPDTGYWMRIRGARVGVQEATLLVLVEPARNAVQMHVYTDGAEYRPDYGALSELLRGGLPDEEEYYELEDTGSRRWQQRLDT